MPLELFTTIGEFLQSKILGKLDVQGSTSNLGHAKTLRREDAKRTAGPKLVRA